MKGKKEEPSGKVRGRGVRSRTKTSYPSGGTWCFNGLWWYWEKKT